MFKRISVLFLTLVMVFCWILPVSAAGNFKLKYSYANNAEITEQMNLLKAVFPAGKYWNGKKTPEQLKDAALSGDFSLSAMGVTDYGCRHKSRTPCSCGYRCTSNEFTGTQCYGFANYVGYLLFPEYGIPTQSWKRVTGSAAKNVTLEPGDIVRYDGHSGIVWKVTDGKVYFAQVYGNHKTGEGQKNHGKTEGCLIQWTTWEGGSSFDTNAELVKAVASNSGSYYILKHPADACKGQTEPPATTEPPAPVVPTITASSEVYPDNLAGGSSFGLRGIYTTDVGSITSVTATLKNSSGSTVYSFKAAPNANSFNVNGTLGTNGKTLNNTIGFKSLSAGTYTLTIDIIAKNSTATKTYSKSIKITILPTITASGERYPSTVTYGSSYGLRGVYTTDAGKITGVTATLKNSSGGTVYSFKATPNAKSFDVNGTVGTNGKNLNNTIGFRSLARGTYTLQIQITVTNGSAVVTKTITHKIIIK